jgi:hypothetical protein
MKTKFRYGNPTESDHFDYNLRMVWLKAILSGSKQLHMALMEGYYDSSVNTADSSAYRLPAVTQCNTI